MHDQENTGIPAGVDLTRLTGLHQTMVEVASVAHAAGYAPPDSFDFHNNVISWAIEWEQAFHAGVAAGQYHQDDWIERTEEFVLAKLADHREHCDNLAESTAQSSGPACGHSACSQHFIDTGSRECVREERELIAVPADLRALSEQASADWTLRRWGVVTGGPVREFIRGKAQPQIAVFMLANSENEEDPEGRRHTNADFAVRCVRFVRSLLDRPAKAIADGAETSTHARVSRELLEQLEGFLAGFEDDHTQEGVTSMLSELRAAQAS